MRTFTQRLVLLCVVALLAGAAVLCADVPILKTEENTFSLYGFLKFDGLYQDHAMNSNLAPRYPKPDTEENDIQSANFTAMNSRFGFKWSGPALDSGTQVRGQLEWDLYDASSRNQMKFRTRLAYLELKSPTYSLQAGQNWDLFAAGLPKTLLTNGFYWETGNLGFRRAQLRYTRFFESGELAVSIGDPTTDAAINNSMPVVEARYALKFGENNINSIALSAAYSSEEVEKKDVDILGYGIDFNLALGKSFSVLGEISSGENLKIFLGRADKLKVFDAQDVTAYDWEGVKSTSGWLEFIYAAPKIDLYLGYAMESLTDADQVAESALQDSDALFLGLIHKLGKGVSYGVEYTLFTGDYKGSDSAEANQLNFSVIYSF